MITVHLASLEDTARLAQALAGAVPAPMMLALCGPLGAGKTQLVRYLASALGAPPDLVTSPTYVLMQRYRARIDVLHLDYYRLTSAAQAWDLGLDEWLEESALTIIEWADKFPETWPENYVRCDFSVTRDAARTVCLSGDGPRGIQWLNSIADLLAGSLDRADGGT